MAASAVPLPPLFLERMSRLLGDEFPAFAAALAEEPRHGLRVNTRKLGVEAFRDISPFPLGEAVPWCPAGFTLTPSPSPGGRGGLTPGKHPYHTAGLYYLQDPSAMAAAELLGPRPGERVLDLAASPGGKTTHLAALMDGRGLLVANEIKTGRLGYLVVNVERWGAGNTVVTNATPERLADHFGAAFDRVLVDAPCSGEGTFRRDPSARRDWSPQSVLEYAAKQTAILRVAAHLVRPGGHLLYSTCTFAPEEDEGTVARFLRDHADFEVVALPQLLGFMPGRPEWLRFNAEHVGAATGIRGRWNTDRIKKDSASLAFLAVSKGDIYVAPTRGAVRLFPHRLAGDGHFVCLLRRRDGPAEERSLAWSPVALPAGLGRTWRAFCEECLAVDFPEERLRLQAERLYLVPEGMLEMTGLHPAVAGVWMGTFKKERFEPAHALALHLRRDQAQNVLDLPSVVGATSSPSGTMWSPLRAYLRGESLPSEGRPGWVLVCADGFPLGWGKRVQGVVKNHFPRGWQVYS
jgi:16S rRNA C967 or C1407 C5-methylase (RsmB/RsmF family)/NOL1/NOP2/fmu family ribosome biogenesis protein